MSKAIRYRRRSRDSEGPLSEGHEGQAPVDEVRGELTHPPADAAGAEPSLLAGPGDNHQVAARRALEMHKAVLGQAAAEECLDFLADEGRQP